MGKREESDIDNSCTPASSAAGATSVGCLDNASAPWGAIGGLLDRSPPPPCASTGGWDPTASLGVKAACPGVPGWLGTESGA